jgi:hypothetical protein
MGKFVAQLFSWVCHFTPILIVCFDSWLGEPIEREKEWGESGSKAVGVGRTISEKWGNHLPRQPTIAALLLGNGGKIEPYTLYYNTHG